MRNLKEYICEGLADWEDDKLYKKISKQTSKSAIKQEIIEWLKTNVKSIQENKLKFDFNTTSITVNYNGDIRYKTNITSLTNGMFQWGEVGGYFDCSFCYSLESLEGAPKEVRGYFDCSYCESLEYLEGAPKAIEGSFICSECKSLKTLEGSPEKVGGNFWCNECKSLTSLEGAPKEVGGNFWCNECKSLTSLEGAPNKVGGRFSCYDCKSLKSLKGAPQKIEGDFVCYHCKTQFTEDDVKKISKVKGKINC